MNAPERSALAVMADASTTLPLTEAQHGIWMGQRLVPDNPSYWTAEALSMSGPLNAERFAHAVDHVLRHALSLHMHVTEDGQAIYPVREVFRDCAPRLAEMPDPSPDSLATEAAVWSRIQCMRPPAPDMCRDALWRQSLIRVAPDHHVWVLWAHHLALDGYGFALLFRAVADSYVALQAQRALPDLAHWSMAAVVDEDLTLRGSQQSERALTYWRTQLSGSEVRTLAASVPMATSVRSVKQSVPPEAYGACQKAAAAANVDWVSWLVAGVAVNLLGHTGGQELVLGWPVMNRMGSSALSVPCMAMNIVPLRIRLKPGQTYTQLAQAIQRSLRDMRPHQRLRHERLRRDLGCLGGARRLFGPVVNVMPFERPSTMGDLRVRSHTVSAGPVEDLSINLVVLPNHGGLQVSLDANPLAYGGAFLATLGQSLQATWAQAALAEADLRMPVCAAPDAVQLASVQRMDGPPIQADPGPLWHGSAVLGMLARHAAQRAELVAVSCDQTQMNYAQLWARAQQLALGLAQRLPAEGGRVLVMLPRHTDTLALILGVWLSDACYVPLDPLTPPARLAMVLDDARPHLVVTSEELAHRFPPQWPIWTAGTRGELAPMPCDARQRTQQCLATSCSAAYVIYTSGSTGRPNGVVVSHAALAHFLAGAGQTYQMVPDDRMLQFAPLHFDASVEELFLPLMAGATVVMRNEAMLASPARFLAACAHKQVSVLDLPTAYWHELAHALARDAALRQAWPACVRLVIIGGEAVQAGHVHQWRQSVPAHVTLLNTYGPTEATVICSTAVLAGPGALDLSDGVPIGQPLPGVRFLIDVEGTKGSLLIAGPTLADGYLGQKALTATRFAPWSGAPGEEISRAYRTGDVVRINSHGQLVFMGRVDDEIKISGHRVDPSEVASAMLACPGVHAAAVLGQTGPDGDKRLVAFYVADKARDVTWWRAKLLARLPAAAVPTCFVAMDSLPRNHNNKVDHHALRARMPEHKAIEASGWADMSPMETLIAQIWQPLLGVATLFPHSDFFALGGASLQAIQATTRLGAQLQREVPVSLLFAHPTLADLACALLQPVAHHPPPMAAGQELAPLLPIQPAQSDTAAALFCIHPAEGLSWCYFGLCRHLPGMGIWGIQSPGITGDAPSSFEELVETYVALIRRVRPQGPYGLLGWSSGGGIAHAVAVRLAAQGETIALLAMMDAYPASIWQGQEHATQADALEALLDVIGARARDEAGQRLSPQAMRALLRRPGTPLATLDEALHERLIDNALQGMRLYRTAQHQPFDGPLLYFKAAIRKDTAPSVHSWDPFIRGEMTVVDIDSDHNGMSQPAPLASIGAVIKAHMSAGQGQT